MVGLVTPCAERHSAAMSPARTPGAGRAARGAGVRAAGFAFAVPVVLAFAARLGGAARCGAVAWCGRVGLGWVRRGMAAVRRLGVVAGVCRAGSVRGSAEGWAPGRGERGSAGSVTRCPGRAWCLWSVAAVAGEAFAAGPGWTVTHPEAASNAARSRGRDQRRMPPPCRTQAPARPRRSVAPLGWMTRRPPAGTVSRGR